MEDRSYEISNAVGGTCEWLLRHERYTTWAASDQALLWIKGKPGSGKSTLLKYAFSNHAVKNNALVLSFFFHGRGDELQKTPLGLLRSLLHQILRQAPDALQDLVDRFEQKRKENGRPGEKWHWHKGELGSFLESSLPKVTKTRPVWLFVDALDECGKDSAVTLVETFKTLLKSIASQPVHLGQFHICFSCRHYPVVDLDEGMFKICAEDENAMDISTFVNGKLAAFRTRTSSTIPALVTKRASGVFMWARLVVERVLDLEREGAGLKTLEAAVRSHPPELDELYQQLIRDMDAASLKLVQWICFAFRPLSIDEMRWAMLIEADCSYQSLQACRSAEDYVPDSVRMKRRVQTLSRGLAEVTHTQAVQFIHQSVKDFFAEKGLSALNGGQTLTEAAMRAHFRFSKICIRYLAMEEIGLSTSGDNNGFSSLSKESVNSDFHFLRYATTSWVAHTQQCDAGTVPHNDLLASFGWPSNAHVESWARIYQILDPYSDGCPPGYTNLVHVASIYGLFGLLATILQRMDEATTYIDARDINGRTPLLWAARMGREAGVKLLLSTGMVDTDAKDYGGRTPLSWAAAAGHKAIVKLLLDTGRVDSNAKDEDGQTPLWRADQEGHKAVASC